MPYKTVSELPDGTQKLPAHGQEIYMGAFNSAFEQYGGDEAKSHATAWTAVETKYKKSGDTWVAKESSSDILRGVYNEIIQEVGKRNATADSSRVRKIITLCNELLSSESFESAKAEEAITEANSTLAWLLEQPATKSEGGSDYPESAYAYVPDSANPSTWQLRLWESTSKEMTRAQLGKSAAALSPGGLSGVQAEIPKESLPAVKRRLRMAYSLLEIADKDIPKWVKEVEMRTLIVDFIPLTEAQVTSKGVGELVVIAPGFNASKKRYYPKETLARDFSVFEGLKMFADHPTEDEDRNRPERSIRDWVATLENVRVRPADGSVVGDYTVVEPWFENKLATLRDKGQLSQIGVSINAVGSASKAKIDGVDTNYIERLIKARSVDFVTEPGAGGRIEIFESANGHELDVDLIDESVLKERRPDIVKLIEDGIRNEFTKEARNKMESEKQVKELEGQVETLTTENAGLKVIIAEASKATAKAGAQAKIKEAVDKAELPAIAKAKVLEGFKDAETDEGITAALEAERKYLTELAGDGKVIGLGPSNPDPDPVKDREALTESFKGLGLGDEEAKIAATGR